MKVVVWWMGPLFSFSFLSFINLFPLTLPFLEGLLTLNILLKYQARWCTKINFVSLIWYKILPILVSCEDRYYEAWWQHQQCRPIVVSRLCRNPDTMETTNQSKCRPDWAWYGYTEKKSMVKGAILFCFLMDNQIHLIPLFYCYSQQSKNVSGT